MTCGDEQCHIVENPKRARLSVKGLADDDELMIRYQRDRDLCALEQLFNRHRAELLRYVLRLVRDQAIAEDVAQQSWLKVIEVAHKGTYAAHSEAAFRTWLFTLARNHLIDEHQRKAASRCRARLRHLGSQEMVESGDPAEHALQRDLAARVVSALPLLPAPQREVITLWAKGFSPRDIARMIKAPRQTVLSRKKYALAKLRCTVLPARACRTARAEDHHLIDNSFSPWSNRQG